MGEKKFEFKKVLPPPAELREASYGILDFAERTKYQGHWFVVLPFRSTGMGAFREHFIRPVDYRPQTVFSWRDEGYDYIAFPHSGQRIVSIYRSNSGIVRVQVIEPAGAEHFLGETSLDAAREFVKGMRQVTPYGIY